MTKKKILICERFAIEALVELKKKSELIVETQTSENLKEAHALIIRSKFKIDSELLEKTPNLEVIVTCTSGYDHIDLKATEKKGITVMYTPNANTLSAAEHTWSLLMSLHRHVVHAHRELKAGNWNRDPYISSELAGKTLGIIGLGRIGSKVSQFAKAFDMHVIAFDPYQDEEVFLNTKAQRVSYEEVLKQSDILTFHVPNTFETHHMFSQSQLEYVNPNLLLINTSRGEVIHEEDLAHALINKKLAGAALDVFTKEPLGRDSKLLKCPNVILTPHLGAYTEDAFLRASLEAARCITNYFENRMTQNTLPLKNNWGTLSFKERT